MTPATSPLACLITGGDGFIGKAVVAALAQRGHPYRLTRRTPARDFEATWTPVAEGSTAVDPADGCESLRGHDAIIHLAARAHILRDQAADPRMAYRAANTHSTLRLAQQAASAGVRRFVFVSTLKVHGEKSLPRQAFTEAMAPAPADPYALSKHEAELGLRAIAEQTGMEVVIIRPPLVYGPGVKANFAALMRAVARGWPLPLGAIDNRRSLVALDNLVDFILTCLDHPAAANQTFLVSDGEDLSTPDLLRRLGVALGRPARLLPVPAPLLIAGAALLGRRAAAERLCGNLQVDICKARSLLGWQPPISVDAGLRRTAQAMAR